MGLPGRPADRTFRSFDSPSFSGPGVRALWRVLSGTVRRLASAVANMGDNEPRTDSYDVLHADDILGVALSVSSDLGNAGNATQMASDLDCSPSWLRHGNPA